MTIYIEGKRGIYLGAQAVLIEDDREVASSWAQKHVVHNPAYRYVLGRFVEADRANNNRQLFSLKGLQMARPSIQHAPMNMNHQYRHVVGAYIAAELIYPTGAEEARGDVVDRAEAAAFGLNPYIEALGVMWKHYFRQEHEVIESAHAEGRLYYSMECVPREIQCAGDGGCGATFAYAGRQSKTYCGHLNEGASDKLLIDPHFTAGAILVPPVQPGWSHADVHSLVAAHADLAEDIYEGIRGDLPHLSPGDWEVLMAQLLVLAHRG
jgi:hypothetical protein